MQDICSSVSQNPQSHFSQHCRMSCRLLKFKHLIRELEKYIGMHCSCTFTYSVWFYTHTYTIWFCAFMKRLVPKHVDIVCFRPKGTLTTLKRIYKVTRSPYLYSAMNFLPYLMWDVTNTPHANTTSSLCSIGLWGWTDEHPNGAKQTLTLRSEIGFDTICNDPLPTM